METLPLPKSLHSKSSYNGKREKWAGMSLHATNLSFPAWFWAREWVWGRFAYQWSEEELKSQEGELEEDVVDVEGDLGAWKPNMQ